MMANIDELPQSRFAEVIDSISAMLTIFGSAFIVAWFANDVMQAAGLNRIVSIVVSGGLFLSGALVLLTSSKAATLTRRLLGWRQLVLLAAAVAVGYQWRAYEFADSSRGRSQEAALWACRKLPECRDAATKYGSANGHDVYIPE